MLKGLKLFEFELFLIDKAVTIGIWGLNCWEKIERYVQFNSKIQSFCISCYIRLEIIKAFLIPYVIFNFNSILKLCNESN